MSRFARDVRAAGSAQRRGMDGAPAAARLCALDRRSCERPAADSLALVSPEPPLDRGERIGLSLVDLANHRSGAPDRREVGRGEPLLGLQLVRAERVDIGQRAGGRSTRPRSPPRALPGPRPSSRCALRRPPRRGSAARATAGWKAASPPCAWLTSAASRAASAASAGRLLTGRSTGTRGSIASAGRGSSDGGAPPVTLHALTVAAIRIKGNLRIAPSRILARRPIGNRQACARACRPPMSRPCRSRHARP